MQKLSIKKMMMCLSHIKESFSLLGIGPMSPAVITAGIESAKQNDYPIFFIASRNQVESRSLGGGYVMNWDQSAFSEFVNNKVKELDFKGLFFLCRDHGGPWQNDKAYKEKLPVIESMKSAIESYYNDLESGFSLFHIDTSKDPFIDGLVPINLAVERAAWFVQKIEEKRKSLNIPPVVYEVSIEETDGRYSSEEEFSNFIDSLFFTFTKNKLPLPSMIVGQTGTLTRMMENYGKFDIDTVKKLVAIAKKNNLAVKEHNTDYLSVEYLEMHPSLGIAMANVAPEFGKIETEMLLLLAQKEEAYLLKTVQGTDIGSQFAQILESKVMNSDKWKKWLPVSEANAHSAFLLNEKNRKDLVMVNGHYFYNHNEVAEAKELLFDNLRKYNIVNDPERLVIDKLKSVIEKYVIAFNLKGLSSRIFAANLLLNKDRDCSAINSTFAGLQQRLSIKL